ncbi:MAG TPA: protein kinase [Gemmatimonadales bacterium]|nr:protein kinase [Gemmatimonadales bacterium]
MDLRAALQAHLGDHHRLDRELGGGGMSRVFVAHEHRLSRDVVIKVLSPELVQGLNAERFEREILLAASLQQANIVPVLAAGEVGGLPYFTMPFIEGESLRARLTGSGLPINEVITILRDITKALAYAHARGIVHRDIKPDNVLLSGGTAVVTDFGIAKALVASQRSDPPAEGVGSPATLTQLGTSIGTPAYMAPEQVAGDPNIDHRVDLYALGCVAHELLSGRSPFADRTPQRMLAAHLTEAPRAIEEVRGDCPPALARLVTDLLAKDAADRPTDAAAVLRVLDSAVTASAPTLAMDAPGMLPRALAGYAAATAMVAILAQAAVVGIGLPSWAFTGAMVVMLLGVPALLFTAWVKRTARRAASAVPTLTPGGSQIASHGTMATLALKANRYVSWRRTVRGGVMAMTAFVVLVAGFMVTRAMGIGPAASLFASGALANNATLVIGDLVAAPVDSSLASIVTEAVRAALSQSRAVRLIEPADVATLLTQMRRPRTARLDAATAREVALRGGAAAVLGGRFVRAGTGYAISIELTGVKDGRILASVQDVSSEADLIKTTDALTRKLRGKIGESLRRVQQSVPLERATTSNLAALQKYSEATRANDIDGDFDRAVALAREAVALDSTFALAWRKLAVAMSSAGLPYAARDSALARAAHFADRLPALERNLVMGNFYESHSSQFNDAKALAAYQAAFADDSTNVIAVNALSRLSPTPADRLVYATRQYALRPILAYRLSLVTARLRVGDTLGAVTALDSIRVATPADTANPRYLNTATRVAIAQRDWPRAIALLKQSAKSENVPFRLAGLEGLGGLEQLSGHFAAAKRAQDQWGRLTAERGGFDYGILWEANRNIRFRGKKALGVQQVQAAVRSQAWAELQPLDRYYTDTVILYALADRPDLARDMMATWQRESPGQFTTTALVPNTRLARGMIAAAEGDHAAAIVEFRAAMTRPDGQATWLKPAALIALGDAFDQLQQPDSVIAYYQAFLALSTEDQLAADVAADGLAKIHKRLGEIYESRGDRARAIEHDAAFVDLWQDADAELQPVVAEVRARLVQLQASEIP